MADADLDARIVRGLRRREPSLDFRSAIEAGLASRSDDEVLAIAAANERILVTHDIRTMPQAFARLLASGRPSPGVILTPKREPIVSAIDDLHLAWSVSTADDWRNRIVRLPL